MSRKRAVSIMLPVATLLIVGACQQNAEPAGWAAPISATPSARPVGIEAPTPTPPPTLTPTPKAKPKPTVTPVKTKKPTQRPATIDTKTACTAVRTPLVQALSGLIAVQVVASQPGMTESDVRQAQSEAIDRLAQLQNAADRAAGGVADQTLQANLRLLSRAASNLRSRIRAARPSQPESVARAAANTSELENATNELEPTCGKYWS